MKTLLFITAMSILQGATTIDQIVAVVRRHPIKMSDIERDLKVTEFLNGQAASTTLAEKKQSLNRLIDQELIRRDIELAGNSGYLDKEAQALFEQLVRDRFHGSTAQADMELRRRGLSKAQLIEQLQWQLVVLRFIDERFRPGVLVEDEEVKAYYEQHLADLKKQYPAGNSFETLAPKIREKLEGDEITHNFEDWLAQSRKSTRIDYKVDELK